MSELFNFLQRNFFSNRITQFWFSRTNLETNQFLELIVFPSENFLNGSFFCDCLLLNFFYLAKYFSECQDAAMLELYGLRGHSKKVLYYIFGNWAILQNTIILYALLQFTDNLVTRTYKEYHFFKLLQNCISFQTTNISNKINLKTKHIILMCCPSFNNFMMSMLLAPPPLFKIATACAQGWTHCDWFDELSQFLYPTLAGLKKHCGVFWDRG